MQRGIGEVLPMTTVVRWSLLCFVCFSGMLVSNPASASDVVYRCYHKKICLGQSKAVVLNHLKALGFRYEQPLQAPLYNFHRGTGVTLKQMDGFVFVGNKEGRGYAIFVRKKLISISFFRLKTIGPTSAKIQEWYGTPTSTDTPPSRSIYFWYDKSRMVEVFSATFHKPLSRMTATETMKSCSLFDWTALRGSKFESVFKWNLYPNKIKELKALAAHKPQRELQCFEGICLNTPVFLLYEPLSRIGYSPDLGMKKEHPFCKKLTPKHWKKGEKSCVSWSFRQGFNTLGQVLLVSRNGVLKALYRLHYENKNPDKSSLISKMRKQLGKETWQDRDGPYYRLLWAYQKTAAGFAVTFIPNKGKPHPVSRMLFGVWNEIRHSPYGSKLAKTFGWKAFEKSGFQKEIKVATTGKAAPIPRATPRPAPRAAVKKTAPVKPELAPAPRKVLLKKTAPTLRPAARR